MTVNHVPQPIPVAVAASFRFQRGSITRFRFTKMHSLSPIIRNAITWVIVIAILWTVVKGTSVWFRGSLPREIRVPLKYTGESQVRACVQIPDSQNVTVIGARKSCDCVLVPNLPWSNQKISDAKNGLNLDVILNPEDKFPMEREVVLFLGPPHSRSLRVLIEIEAGR